MSGKQCPKCDRDIGVLAVMKAMVPSRLFCPHCATALRYVEIPWRAITLTALFYLLVLIFSYPLVISLATQLQMPVTGLYILLAIVLWQPAEFAIALYLRARGVLLFR